MNNIRKYPFFLFLISLIIGIFLYGIYNHIWPAIAIIVVATMLFAGLQIISKRAEYALRYKNLHIVWVGLLFVGMGILTSYFQRAEYPDFANAVLPPLCRARVTEVRDMTYGRVVNAELLRLESESGICTMSMRNTYAELTLPADVAIKPGDDILFIHEFQSARPRMDVEFKQRLREQDFEIQENRHWGLANVSGEVRNNIGRRIDYSSLSEHGKTLLQTCLLGDRDSMMPHERASFSQAGIAHIFALSGLHAGIIAAIVLWVLSPLNLRYSHKLRYIVAAVVLWIYVWLVGMPLSVTRAAVMATFVFVAIACGYRNNSLNALFAAVFFILFISPKAISDVGLQLSFTTVFTLLAASDFMESIRRGIKNKLLCNVVLISSASVAAVVGSWALTAWYFGIFPLLFLPVNLIVLPLLPIYMICGVVYTGLLMLGIDFETLGGILSVGADLLWQLSTWVSERGAVAYLNISLYSVVIWTGALIIGAMALKLRKRYIGYLSILLGLTSIAFIWLMPGESPTGIELREEKRAITAYVTTATSARALEMYAYQINRADVEDIIFIHIDNNYPPSGIAGDSCHYLIIGPRYRGTIEALQKIWKPGTIVTSRYVYSTRDEDLRQECQHIGIPFHSLREDGNLWIPILRDK